MTSPVDTAAADHLASTDHLNSADHRFAPKPGAPELGAAVPLHSLTDEELAALDPAPADRRLVIYPWFDELSPAEQQTAIITAFRGLAARGLVTPPTAADVALATQASVMSGSPTGDVNVEVDPEIANVLSLRRAGRRVVVAQRTLGGREDYLYLYDVADDVVLIELVEPKGLHRFALTDGAGLTGAIEGYLVPEDWPGGGGDDVVIPAGAAAAGQAPASVVELFARAHVQGQFIVRAPGQGAQGALLCTVQAGPDAILASCTAFGTDEPLTFSRLTRAELTAWIAARLS